jgi:carbamoyl-phosphate synthase large subunit
MYKKVMVIGSGPIVIGQGAEFDYSGTQACRVLKEEGIEVVLINSNPATIMTDKQIADHVYSEPLTLTFAKKIIEKELPDAILVGLGGQTALNLGIELNNDGILEEKGITVLGTSLINVEIGEDRELFKDLMMRINQPSIESEIANNLEEAMAVADRIGYPVVVRPAFTLGGSGGGIAETPEALEVIATKGLHYSMVGQVLIEKSIKGWKEVEYEMVRDRKGRAISVCNMENIDPVGIHTGDSIVVAPSQTLSDYDYQMLRTASIDIVNSLEIIGGCNVQLALDTVSHNYYVIEVNPRVSRSSSLASKATGYPIAKVATKLALGYCLDEVRNEITGKTMACFEPALDYCVVKIPKWPFDKFDYADSDLGTAMKATGEVMSIGNNLEMALLKAVRSLEINQYNLAYPPARAMVLDELFERVSIGDPERLFYLAELFRRQVGMVKINLLTGIDHFFLKKIKNIVEMEKEIKDRILEYVDPKVIRKLKKRGFSDLGMSQLMICTTEEDVYHYRMKHGITPVYKMVDTCAAEFDAESPYYYSTYDLDDEVKETTGRKVLVVGSGPIRIGQGVEFDYCSVHGVMALKKLGIEAIMINNNPETVSTDFDISDKLYFEPITIEDVMNIIDREGIEGVILQFGGQTAIKLAEGLKQRGVKILGTLFEDLDATEDRDQFDKILEQEQIVRPQGKGIYSVENGKEEAAKLGYPLLVRPSYVIGGFGMEICYKESELVQYLQAAFTLDPEQSVLIDQFVSGIEVEVDALSDGKEIYIPGIMEHIERAGVHSGDSIAIYPTISIDDQMVNHIVETTEQLGRAFNLVGIFNVQYIVADEKLYVIEVNPRASRTVPMMSKVTGVPMIEIATQLMLGRELNDLGLDGKIKDTPDFYAVKNPVFSMEKLSDAEIALSPEMKSTGETLAIESTVDAALMKGFMAAQQKVPNLGTALVSIADPHKESAHQLIQSLIELGYEIEMTEGTYNMYKAEFNSIKLVDFETISKKVIGQEYQLVFNVPTRGKDKSRQGFSLRRIAIEHKIPCFTSVDTMRWMIRLIEKDISSDDMEIIDLCSITD